MINEYGVCKDRGLIHLCKSGNKVHINFIYFFDLKFGDWKTKKEVKL